ncbi:MAG: peptidylprolyl isomerase [Bacillota bacterium]|nr:peptidylprolyl isomerase [Bacillota bacterium]
MRKIQYKKILTGFIAMSLVAGSAVILSSCNKGSSSSSSNITSGANTSSVGTYDISKLMPTGVKVYNDTKDAVGYQLNTPKKGDQIAIMHTGYGDITLRFFPEAAPKAVENFITHAKNGYYNGLDFHRVVSGFMIQGGDPKGDGTGGESIWKTPFADEFSTKLYNIRGAVAMANSGSNTNGSQFFIDQGDKSTFAKNGGFSSVQKQWSQVKTAIQNYYQEGQLSTFLDQYESSYTAFYNTDKVSSDIQNLYTNNGGNPGLDGAFNAIGRGHTVFAQVISGMDVVDKIAKAAVKSSASGEASSPVSPVKIKSIEVTTYKG